MFDNRDFKQLAQRAFREPGNAQLFSTLLLQTEWLGNYAESLDLYHELLDRHPYCGHAWYNMGWVLTNLSEVEEALDAFEFAYLAQPTLKEAYEACAAWSLLCGRPRRAWLCYDEMMRHVEVDSHDLCRLSMSQRLAGDLDAAKKTCREALKLDPYHAEACYQLAACFIEENALSQALRWLREAVQNDENHVTSHQLLATLYNQLGQYALAHRHAWRAIELAPDFAEAWVCLLESLVRQEHLEEAAQVTETALLHIETVELLYCAAACCFLGNRRPQALRFLQQAYERAPEQAHLLFRWAPQLRSDEDVRKALHF